MENNQQSSSPLPKTCLCLKCVKCGGVFLGHALAYPLDVETSEYVAECVRNGDIPFIAYDGITLTPCKCSFE